MEIRWGNEESKYHHFWRNLAWIGKQLTDRVITIWWYAGGGVYFTEAKSLRIRKSPTDTFIHFFITHTTLSFVYPL